MKRFLTILAVMPFLVGFATSASATLDPEYGWTISDSPTDAYSNEGPFIPGLVSLYLYYACNSKDGMSAAQFDLVSKNAANLILAFTTQSGFLNAGSSTALLLAVGGCPNAQPQAAPVLAGIILVLQNAPGAYHLAPSIDGTKGTVDCNPVPALWPIQWLGYNHEGIEPQLKDWDKCAKEPVSVEAASWGSVKALYR